MERRLLRMYKKLLSILLLILSAVSYSQNYQDVDRRVLNYPVFGSLNDLGIRIQNDFDSDSQRIRAAFIWITHNVVYAKDTKKTENRSKEISYRTEQEMEEAISDLVWSKINRAFSRKRGVCIDYSLMLNALFEQFDLPSKIITGVVKSEIKDINGDPSYRNHSWNAVQLNGRWKLMDATWAAGYVDPSNGRFVQHYLDHYFFTEPSDFVRHHLPANEEWQLLDKPVASETFYAAPIFLPEFCENNIRLSPRTRGILTLSQEKVNYIYFDHLPADHLMHYTINGSGEFKRMGFKKGENNSYTSKIKLRKRFNRSYEYLTVYMNDEPILNFKIVEELAQ